MDFVTTGARIKYYRNLLRISQNQLTMGKLSKMIIYLLENNKKRLTPVTASILVSNFNEIANEKGIEINLGIQDLLMSDEKYADVLCRKWLEECEDSPFDEIRYLKTVELAKEYHLYEHIVKSYEKLYFRFYNERNYTQALTYISESLPSAVLLNDKAIKVNVINRIGTCHHMMLDYEKAFLYYKQAYDEFSESNIKKPELENKLLCNLALTSLRKKNYADCELYLDKQSSLTDIPESDIYKNLIVKANLYLDTDRIQEALDLYKEILNHDVKYLRIIENNMGIAFLRLGKLNESVEVYTNSIKNQLSSLNADTTFCLVNIALVYLKEKKYSEAATFYEYGLNNAKKFNQLDKIVQCYEKLLRVCIEIGKIYQFDVHYKSMQDMRKTYSFSKEQLKLIRGIEQDYTKGINNKSVRR